MRRIISILLSICLMLGLFPTKVMANDLQMKYLQILVDEKKEAYECLWDGKTVYCSVEDLAEITKYEWVQMENSLEYDFFRKDNTSKENTVAEIQTRVFVAVENDKKSAKVEAMGETYSVSCHMIDGELFLPLEKFLYLLHAEWRVGNNIVYVTPMPFTILDFEAIHKKDINKTASQSEDIMINTGWLFSDNKTMQLIYSAIAEVFNDFDGKIFMIWWPGQGNVEIAESYEEAILQLARDDKEFVGDEVQKDAMESIVNSAFYLNNTYLNKIQNIISIPGNVDDIVQSVPDAVSLLEDLGKSSETLKTTAKKIESGKIDTSFLEIPELKAKGKELEAVGDGLAILQCVWNAYDTANRVKGWNEEYLEQLQVLANYKNSGNVNKGIEKYVESSAQRLLKSYHNPDKAKSDEALQSVIGLLLSKTVDESPFGKVFSIMNGVGACYGTFDVDAANTYDAYVELSKVTFSIKIEQMVRELFEYDGLVDATDKLTNEKIKEYRNQLMLCLRLNLRNKAQLYNINLKSNKDKNWINTDQAKEMHNEIVLIYTMLAELIETKDYDSFIVLDKDLEDIHETIQGDVLLDEKPKNNEEIYAEVFAQYSEVIRNNYYEDTLNGYSEEWDKIGDFVNLDLLDESRYYDTFSIYYAFKDVDRNGVEELFIGAGENEKSIREFDLFSYDGSKVVTLFEDHYRSHFCVYENGMVEVTWSASAIQNGSDFFKITSNGYDTELIDSLSRCGDYDDFSKPIKYYHDQEGKNEISEEKFNQLYKKYVGKKMQLQWSKLIVDQDNKEKKEQMITNNSVKEKELIKIEEIEKNAKEIEEKLKNASSQKEMNQYSFQLYKIWDDEINDLWSLLKENLNSDEMDSILAKQKEWIKYKETQMKLAGAEYEGGSMQPMEENLCGADLTQKRVYELVEKLP